MQSLMAEIMTALSEVTPAQIERARGCLTPLEEDEELIIVVDDDEAIRMWTLSHEFEIKVALMRHSLLYDGGSREECNEIKRQACRLHMMEEAIRDLAWRRMEDLAGAPASRQDAHFGLRENFSLIWSPRRDPEMVTSGSIPQEIIRGFVETLRRRRQASEPEETEKPKPQ